jgi:superfamily II DNA or RNA helicase
MTPDELPVRFGAMAYRHPFRHYQGQALDAFDSAVTEGRDRVYLVLPPGAGKTAVGLEAARRLGRPTLVLTPNSAIQAQWVAQWDDFEAPEGVEPVPAGSERELAEPLTVLTYQSLCTLDTPDDPLSDAGERARRDAADERRRNRSLIARGGDRDALLRLLHPNGRSLIQRMKAAGPLGFSWTLVLDECHHLLELWGWLVKAVVDELSAGPGRSPFVLGLTATPPAELTSTQAALHQELFGGGADFAVATPAVVKEGHLAPYTELVQLTTPLPSEADYVAAEALRFQELVTDLLDPEFAATGFLAWLRARVVERFSDDGARLSWDRFERDQPELARAAVRLHVAELLDLPEGARVREEHRRPLDADDWVALIEDYAQHCLGESDESADIAAREAIRRALPAVGWRLTRTGVRAGATPVDRVLARSGSKAAAAIDILAAESEAIGERLRAVVLCDFESAGAELPARLTGVINPQSGGARLLLELLIRDRATAELDPILVTGRSVACSRATALQLIPWLAERTPLAWPNPLVAGTGPAGPRTRVRAASGAMLREWLGGGEAEPGPATAGVAPRPGNSWWEPPGPPTEEPRPSGPSGPSGPPKRWSGRWELGEDDGTDQAPEPSGLLDDVVEIGPLGGAWPPRRYVPLITQFFEEGGSRCLVGTRSLLGEGWDAPGVNVMVDLSAASTPTSVQQMRGRSLRLDPSWPAKVAHNWAVVCVAEGHPKGDADYQRFVRKHHAWFALTEQGAVESGVSHVDPELSPFGPPPADTFATINSRMLARAADRDGDRDGWAIGEPYENAEIELVRIRHERSLGLPGSRVVGLTGSNRPTVALGSVAAGVAAVGGATAALHLPLAVTAGGVVLGAGGLVMGGLRRAGELRGRTRRGIASEALDDLAAAVADALAACEEISVGAAAVEFVPEADGTVRCQLGEGASAAESRHFAEALEELLAPIGTPRYVIPRLILPSPIDQGEAFGLVVRRALHLRLPAAEVWHAVPALLGSHKDRVEVFQAAWNRWVSPGEALFTGSPEGTGILAAARGDDPFQVTTQLRTLWR